MVDLYITVTPQIPPQIQVEEKVSEIIQVSCQQGPAGASSDGFDATCGENVGIGKICFPKTDGKMYLASFDDPYFRDNVVNVFGVPQAAFILGTLASFRQRGNMVFSASSLIQGKTYFLGTLGNITDVPPTTGLLLEVGFALSDTKFILNIKEAILLRQS